MIRWAAATLLAIPVSGCQFDLSTPRATDTTEPPADAAPLPDVSPLAPDADLPCESRSSLFDSCSVQPTQGDLDLTTPGRYLYETDTGILTHKDGSTIEHQSMLIATPDGNVRIIITDNFSISADSSLHAQGVLPFGIVSYSSATIAGNIDVSIGGAGKRVDCGPTAGSNGGDENGGGGGGGGGANQARGGKGGEGNEDGDNQGSPGNPGEAIDLPDGVTGGCDGGNGGDGEDSGGEGGEGGGALYLAAAQSITIEDTGSIAANGGGGQGGQEQGGGFGDAGGGGGGSGGYIFIESPQVAVLGLIAANGGGGGQGSGDGEEGQTGAPGSLSSSPAPGGNGGDSTGSDGGQGGAGTELPGQSVSESTVGGAGGGGGGVGYIRIRTMQLEGKSISPSPLR